MTGSRFIISCLHCKRIVAIAGGIVDTDEFAQLCAHLFACRPDAIDAPKSPIETTLRYFRVEALEPDDRPPPSAA